MNSIPPEEGNIAMWYKPLNEKVLFTPSVLVFPDRIRRNISRMIDIAGRPGRLRPHVKTHKMAEVVRLQVDAGIHKFKCATLAEAEMTAGSGGKDILMAYPLMGPGLIQFVESIKAHSSTRFSATVDSEEAVLQIGVAARQHGVTMELFVDIDNGMNRTGIPPRRADGLVETIHNDPDLLFRGFHVYDGHIHEPDPLLRKETCERDFRPVTELVARLQGKGIAVGELACGGSPTFPVHATHEERILCPGTTLLWDAGYASAYPDLDFLPAAVIAGRVISKPSGTLCMDLGHKSIASEMDHPRLHFLELEPGQVIHHNEEHLVIRTESQEQISTGDLVYALPTHICPTIALHDQVYVIEEGKATGTWKVTARNRTYHALF